MFGPGSPLVEFFSLSGTHNELGDPPCNGDRPQVFYYNNPSDKGTFPHVMYFYNSPLKNTGSLIAQVVYPDIKDNAPGQYFGIKYDSIGNTYVAKFSSDARFYMPDDATFILP